MKSNIFIAGLLCAANLGAQEARTIRETAESILAQPEYQEREMRRIGIDLEWLWEPLREFWDKVTDALEATVGALPAELEYAVYALLVVILIGLIAHIAYTIRKAVRRPDQGPIVIDRDAPAPAHVLKSKALQLAEDGNYVDASRLLHEAALTMLEEKRHGRVRRGLTTNEYLGTFHADWVVENLRVFADLINWKWYRARSFDAEDYARCRQAFETIESRLAEEFA